MLSKKCVTPGDIKKNIIKIEREMPVPWEMTGIRSHVIANTYPEKNEGRYQNVLMELGSLGALNSNATEQADKIKKMECRAKEIGRSQSNRRNI